MNHAVGCCVFDASAILALLLEEPGAALVADAMDGAGTVISSVNAAEVVSKLIDAGITASDAELAFRALQLEVVSATAEHARDAAVLRESTRSKGLSLGDRFCLALASSLPGAQIVTADLAWKGIKGFHFTFIR